MIDRDIVARAEGAATAIRPLADTIEAGRRLPEAAVAALAEAGLFKLLVPTDCGGLDASARTYAAAVETIARADGSAGWCTMIGATSGLMSRFVDERTAKEIYGDKSAVTCGVFAPMGRAVHEGDGLRVSGRWAFASGCQHASYRMGGVLVKDDPPLPSGAPNVRSVLFRADETTIHDTWNTSGLRGTGSHDMEASNVFVPRERTFSLLTDRPRGRPLPFFGLLAAGVAATGLGIARAALDHVAAIARGKRPMGAKRSIAERDSFQLAFARAEAELRSARAFLHDALDEAEDETRSRGEATTERRALMRLAASHAAERAADVANAAFRLAGGGAIYASSPMQRCFRDANVVTQHVMVAEPATTLAGRVLLGLEADASVL